MMGDIVGGLQLHGPVHWLLTASQSHMLIPVHRNIKTTRRINVVADRCPDI